MAKQNNSLTEFNALEGIYEHLSTIDDLTKEVGAISSRLRNIEEQLKEPMEITDPILGQGLTRDTCIYGALAKSTEVCRDIKEHKDIICRLSDDIASIRNLINVLKKVQADLINNLEELHKELTFVRTVIVITCIFIITFVVLMN